MQMQKKSLENAVCYRKGNPAGTEFLPSPCERRAGVATRAFPPFGMTTTKATRDLFA